MTARKCYRKFIAESNNDRELQRLEAKLLKTKGRGYSGEEKNIMGEINKLCNDVSLLKILITYVSDKKFDHKVKEVRQRVKNAIDSHIDTFTGEFLRVVSGWYTQPRTSSWKAYRSVLSSSLEPLN